MPQLSSDGASSSSSPDFPYVIAHVIDKLNQLAKYLRYQSPYAIPNTEPENSNNSVGVCCWKTAPAHHNPPPVDPRLDLYSELGKAERDLKCTPRVFFKLQSMDVEDKDRENLKHWFYSNIRHFLDQMEKVIPRDRMDNDMGITRGEILKEVGMLNKTLRELGPRIASLLRTSDSHNRSDTTKETDAYFLNGQTPRGRMMEMILESPAFTDFYEDFVGVFKNFDRKTRLCLLCFSAFPLDAVVKKRPLIYWWIGEGFIGSHVEANRILYDLVTKGFIQPVLEKRRQVGFKMERLVRPVLVAIARELGFLNFDRWGVPHQGDFGWSHRLCLVESGVRLENQDQFVEKVHTIINVNSQYPDFVKSWFSKMTNLNVLCLGGWQGSAHPDIDIEDTEFLNDLKIMKCLKLLSLQGISGITELPDAVCKLNSLLILDLKACYNLEVLPRNLKALKNLTYLDISECFMLDHIPEGLSALKKLQVLKGFVAHKSVSKNLRLLEELAQLKKLRKLSIYAAREEFPEEEEVRVLQNIHSLENLMLTWQGKLLTVEAGETSETSSPAVLRDSKATRTGGKGKGRNPGIWPAVLNKLELQFFPGTAPPKWLTEGKLKPLKKLYICRGNLQSLCNVDDMVNEWSVKILRLKHLNRLNMNWLELKRSFPDLVYLEKVQCPRLTLFPCDESGVWQDLPRDKEPEELNLGLTWSFIQRRTA